MRKIILISSIILLAIGLLKFISYETGVIIDADIIGYTIFVIFILATCITKLSGMKEWLIALKKAGIWLAIFSVIIIIYAFKSEFRYGFEKVAASVWPSYVSSYNLDKKITIARSIDGHFYVRTTVNNQSLKFMIDTGASDVAISAEDAKKIGIDPATLKYTKEYSTANGITRAAPIMLNSIKIGPAVITKVKAHINEGKLDVSLLGMSVISRFKSFRIDGNLLILEY